MLVDAHCWKVIGQNPCRVCVLYMCLDWIQIMKFNLMDPIVYSTWRVT